MNIRVIVNPRAGAGRAQREIPRLSELFRRSGLTPDIRQTERGGHAAELARDAVKAGVSVLAVLGGDGTFNEVSQAYLDDRGRPVPGPDLALIPCGTGGDLRRTFNLTNDLKDALQRIERRVVQPIDLGVAEFVGLDGSEQRRAFLNVASFGITGEVATMANNGPKWLGRATFLGATVLGAMSYRNRAVRLRCDGELWYQGRLFAAAFCNGRYFGGGMKVAPHARPASGRLAGILVKDLTKLQAYALTTHLYDGSHLKLPNVEERAGTEFYAEPLVPTEQVRLEIDGETPGVLPLRVRLHPGAVSVLVTPDP